MLITRSDDGYFGRNPETYLYESSFRPEEVQDRGTRLGASTRGWLYGSIMGPKSMALPKTVKPWHPFLGFVFQMHTDRRNALVPSSVHFLRPLAEQTASLHDLPCVRPVRVVVSNWIDS